jgi:hypothetical protein
VRQSCDWHTYRPNHEGPRLSRPRQARLGGEAAIDHPKELRLDWHTVKALERQYMRGQLRRAGRPRTPSDRDLYLRVRHEKNAALHAPMRTFVFPTPA